MTRAIVSLALHRLRGRLSATLLLIAAITAATAVASTIASLSDVATDTAVQQALAAMDPGDRALRVTGFAPSSDHAADLEAAARASLADASSLTTEPVAGAIFRSVRDPITPYDLQVVAVDGPSSTVDLSEGRLPAPCDGHACEAILLSAAAAPADLATTVHIAGLEIRIVGRGTLTTSVPLSNLDQRGPERPGLDTDHPTAGLEVPPAFLLVDGVTAITHSPDVATVGRQYFWTAPLRADVIHPWSVDPLLADLDQARARLAAAAPSLNLFAPTQQIDDQLARGAINAGRLLLVGSLGIAILVAFAAYAALLGRRDLRHELERLAAAGGGRRSRALLVALEAGIPTLAGAALGWAAAVLLLGVAAPTPGAPSTLPIAAVVAGLAFGAVLLGLVGSAGRQALVGLLPGFAIAAGLIAWRLGAGLDASALAGGTDQPILALLPAATGLAIAGVALLVVPRLLRRLARAGARFGLPVRLALLSIARDPARPAATLTLLAFGLGGLVFAVTDAATLQQGITDRAAFETGGDLRVVEAGTGLTLTATVVPTNRYQALGSGVETFPVVHAETTAAGTLPVTAMGMPPEAISALRGWRGDESATSATALGQALVTPGTFDLPGHQLAASDSHITIDVQHDGDPVDIWVVIRGPLGDATRVFMGSAVTHADVGGRVQLVKPIPEAARGGKVIAVLVSEARLIAGQDHPAKLADATLTIGGLEDVVGPGPHHVQASGVTFAVLRPAYPTDGLVLPAIVSPELAAIAARSDDGTVPLALGERSLVRIRVAGVATRFPTILDPGRAFAILPIAPMLTALDAAAPGAGQPDEAWLRLDDPSRHDAVVAALRTAPFRSPSIVDRAVLAADETRDPFASSILLAFAAAAVAGLLLAALGLALGAAADLADETGELRDLEAQGLGPRAIRRQVATRTAVLAAFGLVAGVAVGLALAAIVTGRVAVAADVSAPLPPLELVIPWLSVAAAVALPLLAAALLAWLAARTTFRGRTRATAPRPRPRTLRTGDVP